MKDRTQYLSTQISEANGTMYTTFRTKGTKEDKQKFIDDFDSLLFERFDWLLNGSYGSEYINAICHSLRIKTKEKQVAINMFNFVACLEWNISISQLRNCYKKLNVNFKELNKKVVEAFQSFYENFNVESIY